MKEIINNVMLLVSILVLACSIFNIYIYYRDVKEIQELRKEELRLRIEILQNNK